MKKHLLTSLILTLVFVIICGILYPLLVAGIAKFAPGGGKGETLTVNGKVVGYANEGQKFTLDKYFWGRPSAVGYNAAGSGGSNKAPSDSAYLKGVEAAIDTFLVHDPTVKKGDIPSDLVTASGSGLDPDISVQGALVQVNRIAKVRNFAPEQVLALVNSHVEKPLWGLFGPEKINVLKLNIALDELKK
jgi:K+-transporting ATPase ATPase C chain